MANLRERSLESLKAEARSIEMCGEHKLPDYAGVDKYDWSPADAEYRWQKRKEYLEILEEIERREKMSE